MSAEIIKVYKQDVPALRFIGKKYWDSDRVNGMFAKQWQDCLKSDFFDVIMQQTDKDIKTLYEDAGSYIGLMRYKKDEPFQYWIGMFMPAETEPPDGFDYHDFPKSTLGVCWVYGNDKEIFLQEEKCKQKLKKEGYEIATDDEGAYWFFERYVDPRSITPDEKGNFTIDICWNITSDEDSTWFLNLMVDIACNPIS